MESGLSLILLPDSIHFLYIWGKIIPAHQVKRLNIETLHIVIFEHPLQPIIGYPIMGLYLKFFILYKGNIFMDIKNENEEIHIKPFILIKNIDMDMIKKDIDNMNKEFERRYMGKFIIKEENN